MRKRSLFTILMLAIALSGIWAGGSGEIDDDHGTDVGPHDEIPNIPQLISSDGRLELVASTNIIGDVLRNVVDGDADVAILIPVGQNPHSYEPTPTALRTLESADIVFTNGLGLEESLLAEIHGDLARHTVPVSVGIEPLGTDAGDDNHHEDDHDDHDDADSGDAHAHGEGDPHVWMDPNNVVVWVRNMIDVLSAADPSRAERYRERGEAYNRRLEELDRTIRELVDGVPQDRRKLVLDHESFTYFADEYGFETIGTIIPGTSDRAEPSAQAMARLVDVLREENAGTIFVARTASRDLQRLAGTIAAEVGREVTVVETLTGSLAPAGDRGDTYIDLVQYNVEQIVNGLSP